MVTATLKTRLTASIFAAGAKYSMHATTVDRGRLLDSRLPTSKNPFAARLHSERISHPNNSTQSTAAAGPGCQTILWVCAATTALGEVSARQCSRSPDSDTCYPIRIITSQLLLSAIDAGWLVGWSGFFRPIVWKRKNSSDAPQATYGYTIYEHNDDTGSAQLLSSTNPL